MFTIYDIKIGNNLKDCKKKLYSTENPFIIDALPSFCCSEWQEGYNLDNKKEKLYFLTDDNGIVIDITDQFTKAVDCKVAEKTMDFILDNFA